MTALYHATLDRNGTEDAYRYQPGSDGCCDTFEIRGPGSDLVLVDVGYWHEREKAEAIARLIVDALNAYGPQKVLDIA